jgi:hypothetical protein
MSWLRRSWTVAVLLCLALMTLAPRAVAQGEDGPDTDDQIVLTGRLVVPEDETAQNAVLFSGDAVIDGTVAGWLVVFNGRTVITGTVEMWSCSPGTSCCLGLPGGRGRHQPGGAPLGVDRGRQSTPADRPTVSLRRNTRSDRLPRTRPGQGEGCCERAVRTLETMLVVRRKSVGKTAGSCEESA